jgi:protein-tyrosine phosphatase
MVAQVPGLIDWHCHLLPGIDDGPATVDEAIEMAKYLAKAGYNTVYCTPHLIKGSYEADNDAVRAALNALQAELKNQQTELKLFSGREYYLDEFLPSFLKNPIPLGETSFLMLEIPDHIPQKYVREICYRIKASGYIPMIAHPERWAHLEPSKQKQVTGISKRWNAFSSKLRRSNLKEYSEGFSLLNYLRDIGCVFQGNTGSFTGLYGEKIMTNAVWLKRQEIYTHYGTDLHAAVGGNADPSRHALPT